MSSLRDRVEAMFAAGHVGQPPELWVDPRLNGDEQLRPAAVLIAITNRATPGMLLLHRPSHMRAHPGQIAFPGGRLDEGETPVEAALREAWEELGLNPALVDVIGTSDIYHTGSGYEITPVLGIIPADLALVPNPSEVASWFEAPVTHLLNPANHEHKSLEHDGATHDFIEINWHEHAIWGVTAAILANLSKRMNWHG